MSNLCKCYIAIDTDRTVWEPHISGHVEATAIHAGHARHMYENSYIIR